MGRWLVRVILYPRVGWQHYLNRGEMFIWAENSAFSVPALFSRVPSQKCCCCCFSTLLWSVGRFLAVTALIPDYSSWGTQNILVFMWLFFCLFPPFHNTFSTFLMLKCYGESWGCSSLFHKAYGKLKGKKWKYRVYQLSMLYLWRLFLACSYWVLVFVYIYLGHFLKM